MGGRNTKRGWVNSPNAYLTDSAVEAAGKALTRTAQATVATMTEYHHSPASTLPMCFSDDVLAKLKQVRDMVHPAAWIEDYQILPGVQLHINFKNSLVPTIVPERFQLNYSRASDLLHYIKSVEAIHMQFEEVKAVLRWLNRNATPGAIRYYFPTAMKLCPGVLADEVPTRHKTPEGISDWMQPIRDAAATVASSLMLPSTAEPRARGNMWLTFAPKNVHLAPAGAVYTTDQISYNI